MMVRSVALDILGVPAVQHFGPDVSGASSVESRGCEVGADGTPEALPQNMETKIISITPALATIPTSKLDGVWSGYEILVAVDGVSHILETDIGLRGRLHCTVQLSIDGSSASFEMGAPAGR